MERLDSRMSHEWHVAINKFNEGKHATGDWCHWMYEAKTLADEVPRLMLLFSMEREGKLPKVHVQCKHCAPDHEHIEDNHLTCCLGVECRACPHLLAIDSAKLSDEQKDQAKAWTCATHIVSEGGDQAGEGYLMTKDDRMYWDRVYQNLAASDDDPALTEG
jgi:hypothetical protein